MLFYIGIILIMNVTIYHNPRCSKSRQTLEIIQNKGIEPKIVPYLNEPLNVEELTILLKKLDISPRDLMRANESKEAGLDDESMHDDDLIIGIASNPAVIERPIVITNKGARICRPPELVEDIL